MPSVKAPSARCAPSHQHVATQGTTSTARATARRTSSRPSAVGAVKAYLLLADRKAKEVADPLAEQLLVMEERNLTGSRGSIPPAEQNVPGFSIMFVMMGVLFGVAFGLHDERDWGSITRLLIAPIPRASLLGGKLLARFVVGLAQLVLLFAYGHFAFGLSLGQSPVALALVMAATIFSMTGFSLLVAAFARTREQVIPLGLTLIMVFCAIGGCWWPLYQMPPWLRQVAQLAFTTWAIEGLHDVILRDRGVLVAYGAVCLAGGAWFQRLDPA